MANYEKRVEQEAAYPIPISLYNCYRIVRHEKHYQEYIAMPLFSCLYKDIGGWCMQSLIPLVFHNLPSLYPPSFRRNDVLLIFGCANAIVYHHC